MRRGAIGPANEWAGEEASFYSFVDQPGRKGTLVTG